MDMRAPNISRRGFCGCLGLASLGAAYALSGCGSRKKAGGNESSRGISKLAVCTDGTFDYALCGYYVARFQGLFKAELIEIDEVSTAGGTSQLELLNGGTAKICFSSQDVLAPMYAIPEPASIEAVAAFVQPLDAHLGYQHIVVANDFFLISHQETALAFLRALELGYRYCHEQTIEAAQMIAAQFSELDERECSAALGELSGAIYDKGGIWGGIDTGVWDARNAALFEQGTIDAPIYTHHGFNLDYLPSAETT